MEGVAVGNSTLTREGGKVKTNIVAEKLNKLGNGTTAIAAHLQSKRIKGTVGDENSCPLANYLTKELGADEVSVTEEEAIVTIRWPLKKAFTKFVTKFDNGNYPDLEAN
jgi:hypothetical protein